MGRRERERERRGSVGRKEIELIGKRERKGERKE